MFCRFSSRYINWKTQQEKEYVKLIYADRTESRTLLLSRVTVMLVSSPFIFSCWLSEYSPSALSLVTSIRPASIAARIAFSALVTSISALVSSAELVTSLISVLMACPAVSGVVILQSSSWTPIVQQTRPVATCVQQTTQTTEQAAYAIEGRCAGVCTLLWTL